MVWIAKSGHPCLLLLHKNAGRVLLHDQAVIVLVQLRDLLLFEFLCCEGRLNNFDLNWHGWWLEDWSGGRHTSLKLDVDVLVVLSLNVILE